MYSVCRFLACHRFLQFSKVPFFSHGKSRNFMFTSVARSKSMKLAIVGAAGPTGRSLALFLKQSSLIDQLTIYDKVGTESLALELNHIDTQCRVYSCENNDQGFRDLLHNAKIVVITAAADFDIGQSSKDALSTNATILLELIPKIVEYCPKAFLALATSPINSLVPFLSETMNKHGVYDCKRIFGVITLDCMRANTFAAQTMGLDPECVMVPVIGGNCSKTCVPVFSQMKPNNGLTYEEVGKLICAVRGPEGEENRENRFNGTLSLSLGYATARFCISLCKALRDQRNIVDFAYTRSCAIPEVTYFAGPVVLGPCGVQKHLDLPTLTDRESKILRSAIPHLKEAIKMGEVLTLGPRGASTEKCPQQADICSQEISGKMRKRNSMPQVCPT